MTPFEGKAAAAMRHEAMPAASDGFHHEMDHSNFTWRP